MTDSARYLLGLAGSATMSVRPHEVSMLYMLNYIASAGNEQNPGRECVVGMSPAMLPTIDFAPALPANKLQLSQHYAMGSIAKVMAVYPTAFWREAGLTGQATSDQGPVDVTYDNSPEDGSVGILIGFISASEMRRLDNASPEQLEAATIECFARYFGDAARDHIDFGFMRWDGEEYSRGGPVATTRPGALTDLGSALREPCGAVHWAGTETADYWTGYMDGAVRSGERAAQEILAEL